MRPTGPSPTLIDAVVLAVHSNATVTPIVTMVTSLREPQATPWRTSASARITAS
jgi:hypothetical protein